MDVLDKLTKLNELQNENEKLKNICLEYEQFKKSMVICLKEKDELISKYRNYKAKIMKKIVIKEDELATSKKIIGKLMINLVNLKTKNTNLKEELTLNRENLNEVKYTPLDEGNEASQKDILSEIKTSDPDTKEKEYSSESKENKKVIKTNTGREDLIFAEKIRLNKRGFHKYSSYTCDICNKIFKNRKSIFNHIIGPHSENKLKNKCQYCSRKMYNYRRHLCRSHPEEYKKHKEKENLEKGFKINYSSYTCDLCNKIFRKKTGIFAHITEVHLKKKAFEKYAIRG